MKSKISITVDEELLDKIEESLKYGLFRNKRLLLSETKKVPINEKYSDLKFWEREIIGYANLTRLLSIKQTE